LTPKKPVLVCADMLQREAGVLRWEQAPAWIIGKKQA
jgi:hypothetical protein